MRYILLAASVPAFFAVSLTGIGLIVGQPLSASFIGLVLIVSTLSGIAMSATCYAEDRYLARSRDPLRWSPTQRSVHFDDSDRALRYHSSDAWGR